MRAGNLILPCALGKGGIRALKREGDGATPLGSFAVLGGYYRRGRAISSGRLPLLPIRPDLGWCDAPGDRNYNRPVRLPYKASHERMQRDDHLYDICLILDCNLRPRRRGMGSAIFFHQARAGFSPTEGCVAISPRAMRRLLPYLTKRTRVVVSR